MFLFQSISAAQSSPPKTVLDYYLLLPEKYFEANKEQRVKWMLDPGNGSSAGYKEWIHLRGGRRGTDTYLCLPIQKTARPSGHSGKITRTGYTGLHASGFLR